MKTLIVLRHAKSDHPIGTPDFERGLTERGKQDALRVGEVLGERSLVPDVVVTSTARRARKTTNRVVKTSGYSGEVFESDEIYDAGVRSIMNVVASIPDDAQSALIVGHNPGFWGVVETLTEPIAEFPTSAWAQITLDVESWSDITGSTQGALIELWFPRLDRPK